MAKAKLSPRQKMINLMYLVFIAMLALQVDQEVLRSFLKMDRSLTQTNELIETSSSDYLSIIKDQASKDPKYDSILNHAVEMRGKTKQVLDYIDGLKQKLNTMSDIDESAPSDEINYSALAKIEPITKLFFVKANKNEISEEGKTFINNLKGLKDYFLELNPNENKTDQESRLTQTLGLLTEPWLGDNFFEQPMIASRADLTKIQTDIKNEEALILREMLTGALIKQLKVDSYKAFTSVPGFVEIGEKAEAYATLAPVASAAQGYAMINGQKINLVDGKAPIKLNTSTAGKYTVSGSVFYQDPETGKFKEEKFETRSYEVVAETLSQIPQNGAVTADYMNVVYRGVTNPLSAVVAGTDRPATIQVVSGGGSLTSKGNGKYDYRPSAPAGSKVVFRASAQTSDGKTTITSPPFEYRVKSVPKAIATVRGQTNPRMPASSVSNAIVKVEWPDFEFPVNGTVKSFKVKVSGELTQNVSGNKVGNLRSLKNAKRGDIVNIFDIRYTDPSGVEVETNNSVAIEISN